MNIVAFVTGLLGHRDHPDRVRTPRRRASNKGKADLKWMGIVGAILGYLEVVFWIIVSALIIGGALSNVTN